MTCPHCRSNATSQRRHRTELGYRRFHCRSCRRRFNERTGSGFNELQYQTDIVLLAVLWRLRYKLGFRDVAELLLQRGYEVTHETIRGWEARFAPLLAGQLCARRRGQASREGHENPVRVRSESVDRLVGPARSSFAVPRPSDAVQAERVRELFRSGRLVIRPVVEQIAFRAAEIGNQFPQLMPADCVHIATAEQFGVDALFTRDGDRSVGRRRPKDMLRYDGQINGLRIVPPFNPMGEMFDRLKMIPVGSEQPASEG